MSATDKHMDPIRKQFVQVAHELAVRFPDIDLRFSLTSGTKVLRYRAANISSEILEVELGSNKTQDIINEAILTIKALARHFDA